MPSRLSSYLNPSSDDIHGVGEGGSCGGCKWPRYSLQEEMGTVFRSQAGKLFWKWERERERESFRQVAAYQFLNSTC